MSLPRQSMLIGFLFVVGATGGRIRRHDFFSFPRDDDRFGYRSHIRDDFFSKRFEDERPNRNQFFAPQPPTNTQDFQSQGRIPFTMPLQPGPPAFIDSPQRDSSTVRPDTVVTTASPAFLACMQNCPTTSEYNPICGTNRQLYFNKQKFDCAVRCGARTEIWRRGSCEGLFPMSRG